MNLFRNYANVQQNIEQSDMDKEKISLIDRIIEKLPEIHVRGYNYCGPNTDLSVRLKCGDIGVNKLDCACMEHDIAYAKSRDLKSRCMADKLLILKALKRIYAKDSRIGERFIALLVSGLISIKWLLCKIELCFNSAWACSKLEK